MTITRALSSLKNLDKKIEKLIGSAVFVSVRGELRQPDNDSLRAVELLQQIQDLQTHRDKLKSAIVISNANTRVKIAKETMTVAEAIERKKSIKHKISCWGH